MVPPTDPPRRKVGTGVLKSRSRLVTFRLTYKEYEAVMALCVAEGSRSLSELAREAVMYRVYPPSGSKVVWTDDLNTLGHRLQELDARVEELTALCLRLKEPDIGIEEFRGRIARHLTASVAQRSGYPTFK